MKKLLLIITLLAALPAIAHDFEVDGIFYNKISDTEVAVTYRGTYSYQYDEYTGDVIIPSNVTYNSVEYSVTSISEQAFYNCSGLSSVIIPNSVFSIDTHAFTNCSGLTSVTIPNFVTSINTYAFAGCSGLSSVNIGNSVTSISEYAFSRCSGLTNVNIGNSVTSISDYAFSECSSLTSVTIPNSVCLISYNAFKGCKKLETIIAEEGNPNYSSESGILFNFNRTVLVRCPEAKTAVEIPNSVTSIGDYAFSSCSALKSVTIPNSVISIGNSAFSGCSSLTSVTIPNSVTSIGNVAFSSCTALTSISIPNSVTSIGIRTFLYCTALTSVIIPNSITAISTEAFSACNELISIYLPSSVSSIEDNPFSSCKKLENIIVDPDNQNYISENGVLFNSDKTNLISCPAAKTDCIIPNSITTIGNSAFSGCNSLTSLSIPNTVKSIGDFAFSSCRSLTSVTLPNSVTLIGDGAFSNCTGLQLINLPNTIGIISDQMFDYCTSLKSITIPTSVTSIGRQAFRSCYALTSLTIPNSVTSIGDRAFLSCRALASVSIPNSVKAIEDATFFNCTALVSITVPNTVSSIGENAFAACEELKSIFIPNSITSIGEFAFACKNLKDIYYLSDTPIAATNIFSYNSIFTTATLHVLENSLDNIVTTEPWMNFENIDTNIEEALIATASPIFNDDMGDVITIGSNSKYELAPALHAFGPAKGVQFDLTLPNGLSLSDVAASGADKELTGLVASHAKLENGDYCVLIYTNDGEELGNLMLGMSFESDATLERGTALCHNIIHSIFDTEVVLDDETAFVTGYDVTLPEVNIEELETFTLPAPLSATIDNVTYRWGEVEPSDIASLSSEGVITAKKSGDAVYSLYVKDGDRPEKKYTALLEVIASLWGDADKDGSVNISDLVAVANYILERSPENFDTRLADIDHNGRINIVDLTGIVKLILSHQAEETTETYSTFSARQELAFGEVETLADNRHRIALEIEPTDDYTAMQTDIRLPEGVKLEALTLGDDLNGHTVDYAEIDPSTVRVIIYSPTLAGMTAGKKTAVADLVLLGDLNDDAIISAEETLACDTDGYAYSIASTDKGIGGTTAINTTVSGECKALSIPGGIELTAPEATAVRITDLSGRCVAETIAPATVSLEAGVYLVTFENIATLKVIVK